MVNQADPTKSVRLATACTECQRRKQKCSREWPCNHCQARRIAHLCKFAPKRIVKATRPAANDKSTLNSLPQRIVDREPDLLDDAGKQTVIKNEDFRALGYLHDDPCSAIKEGANTPGVNLPKDSGTRSSEMENALRAIPSKPYTDMLVQHFLTDTNYQYYILYPPTFSSDYIAWWTAKANGHALTPEFTCLLLHVCACSACLLDTDTQRKLESELGENISTLSRRYHHMAKQLSSTIAPGKGGLTQVQQLFLNALWFKIEASFVEAWHALSTAIHEAQELGMHRSSSRLKLSEFDIEMRRRVWCILYAWDWQMSLLLSRPFIINSNYCSFELPNLRLESPECEEGLPSPITPLALECQLGQMITKIPGVMGGILSPSQAVAIQQETERWFASLPSIFSLTNPDTRWDTAHNYILVQRSTLHVIGYMVMLLPLKQCLTKTVDTDAISIERSLQPMAVDCALKLLEVSRQHLSYLPPRNLNFHFAPFLIFDSAAFLCSAILHDPSRRLFQRDRVIEGIGLALESLGQSSRHSNTSALCYRILIKLSNSMALSPGEKSKAGYTSPEHSTEKPRAPPNNQPTESSINILEMDTSVHASRPFGTAMLGMDNFNAFATPDAGALDTGMAGLADIPHLDLGELSQIWDWDNLDLDIPCEPIA
ncbi:fungal-specific transcription factor domain-containing protein [Aspergillus floccosus]